MSDLPFFRFTPELSALLEYITVCAGELSGRKLRPAELILRNTCSCREKASAVIGGRTVQIAPEDLAAANNAYEVYGLLDVLHPYRTEDLLLAHRIMMRGLLSDNGRFRDRLCGISGTDGKPIRLGSFPDDIPDEISELFSLASESTLHPLLLGSVVHYGLTIIHPFSNGNGRVERFWQTLILSRWLPVFKAFPMETVIAPRRADYYSSITKSYRAEDCTAFITFLLRAIRQALEQTVQKGEPRLEQTDL